MSHYGRDGRLSRLLPRGRTVLVPLDDALISGPAGGLERPDELIREALAGGVVGFMGFIGTYRACFSELIGIPFVLNLTASTVRSRHTTKVLVGSVEQALAHGCDGVAVHVNLTAESEPEMIHQAGQVAAECQRFGMPLMAIVYPRRHTPTGDYNYEQERRERPEYYATLVQHAARLAVELGADIVKIQYPGTVSSLRSVIESACGVPILIAGGARVDDDVALQAAASAMTAGASGVCFGRQVFQRTDVTSFCKRLVECVMPSSLPV